MKLNIADNIRTCRRNMKLTQEQLADALGVTVGAVSKWESGANTPDIGLIAELADFFEMSIDALLGYDMPKSGVDSAKKRIGELAMDKKFAEARVEMDKALAKYPNNFDIVRICASNFNLMGIELSDESAHRKSLELYQKALTLISQNTDPNYSEWSIKNRIAETYMCLEEYDTALELMKVNNAQGTNNGSIAALLAENCGRYDEGLDYMSDDLVDSITHICCDSLTAAMAYIPLGRPGDAERMIIWVMNMVEGLATPGAICQVQREAARLRIFAAFAAMADGRRADAMAYLAKAHELLRTYLRNPDNSFSGTWIKNGEKYRSFDDMGDDVISGARVKLEKLQARLVKAQAALPNFDPNGKTLPEMWDECV